MCRYPRKRNLEKLQMHFLSNITILAVYWGKPFKQKYTTIETTSINTITPAAIAMIVTIFFVFFLPSSLKCIAFLGAASSRTGVLSITNSSNEISNRELIAIRFSISGVESPTSHLEIVCLETFRRLASSS